MSKCGYCNEARPLSRVESVCPVHGVVRKAWACEACIPNPSGTAIHVHEVLTCPRKVTLRPLAALPSSLLDNPEADRGN